MAARRSLVVLVLVALVLGACGSASGPSGDGNGARRRVLVDYKHDRFAGSFLSYFPKRVKVHAGDTVEFQQAWSGEPHSVTMGTLVDELGKPFWDILDPLFAGEKVDIPEAEPDAPGFYEKLPFMLDEQTLEVIQAGAQPCYLDEGAPDFSDYTKPCPKRPQPAFNGKQSYYSSGFIPFQGAKGNTFELPLAKDIAPGTYHYYCNLHFVGMSGTIEVVPDGVGIPSQDVVNRKARAEASADATLLQQAIDRVERTKTAAAAYVGVPMGDKFEQEHPLFHAQVDEFAPSTIDARVGKPVTWTWAGFHDIAFNVPKYFPLAEVKKDGTVVIDRRAFEAVKFPAPKRPDGEQAGPGGEGPPPEPIVVDGGTFDGTGGLHSTGADYNAGDKFTLTFTKEGTYLFACLIHPAMVGKVVVR